MYFSSILTLHTAPVTRRNLGSALSAGKSATHEKTYLKQNDAHIIYLFQLVNFTHTRAAQAKLTAVEPAKVDQKRPEQGASS